MILTAAPAIKSRRLKLRARTAGCVPVVVQVTNCAQSGLHNASNDALGSSIARASKLLPALLTPDAV